MSLNKPSNEIDISTLANQDTLENVQTTVNTMNTTLGNYGGGDTDNIVSDIEALKQAVSLLTTKTDSLQENVTGIETVVNQIASGGSGSTSGIKRIQKGTFVGSSSSRTTTINLTNFTNINKMIAIVNGTRYESKSDGDDLVQNVFISEFTVSKLLISSGSRDGYMEGYYQVIEFY